MRKLTCFAIAAALAAGLAPGTSLAANDAPLQFSAVQTKAPWSSYLYQNSSRDASMFGTEDLLYGTIVNLPYGSLKMGKSMNLPAGSPVTFTASWSPATAALQVGLMDTSNLEYVAQTNIFNGSDSATLYTPSDGSGYYRAFIGNFEGNNPAVTIYVASISF